jgi:hypothetical protein
LRFAIGQYDGCDTLLSCAQATVLAARRARRAARAATQIATGGSTAIGVLPDALTAEHRVQHGSRD